MPQVYESTLIKLKEFRSPKKLQYEALVFLVNNIVDIDFKGLRESFRAIDIANTGIITLDQIKKGFVHDNYITHIDIETIEELFNRVDVNKTGKINYSEFLAATIDKEKALTEANIEFVFHHYDTNNKGYITKTDLIEVSKRQGSLLTSEQVHEIIR